MNCKLIFYRIFILLCSIGMLTACETSLEITNIDIGKFPDRIIYIANEDNSLDLKGCTMLITTRSNQVNEYVFEEKGKWTYVDITHNIDFTKPGVYEVVINWDIKRKSRFPVQVVDKSLFKE